MILENIKTRTLENHKLMEQTDLLKPIVQETITKDQYIKILKTFYGFFFPLEKAIEKHQDLATYLPDLDARRKSSLLLQDLELLTQSGEVRVCSTPPKMDSLSAALGCLYVMEGSTLGGRMISKILKDKLNIDADSGASFFNGYGADTGNKWKKFQEALVAYSTDPNRENEVIDAANETFSKFREWVNSN